MSDAHYFIETSARTLARVNFMTCVRGTKVQSTGHQLIDARKECESCGNARFRERKWCSLLSNVKTFAPQRKKWTRLLQCLNCPMFTVRLWITTSLCRWPIGSLPSTCMFYTLPHCTKDVYTPQRSIRYLWTVYYLCCSLESVKHT
jgi:hypothetical protein